LSFTFPEMQISAPLVPTRRISLRLSFTHSTRAIASVVSGSVAEPINAESADAMPEPI